MSGTASPPPVPLVPNVLPEYFVDNYGQAITYPAGELIYGDTDPNPGGTLSVTSVGTPTAGTATLNPDGSITYTAPATYVPGNMVSFNDVVKDSATGAWDTGTVYINLIGTPTPQPPVVKNQTISTDYGQAVTLTKAQILAGDSDPNPGGTLTDLAVGTATSGTATLNSDGSITYVPPTTPVANNQSSFNVQIADSATGQTATETIAVNLNTRVYYPPTVQNQTLTMNYGQTLPIPSSVLLQGDTDFNPGGTLSVSAIIPGDFGTATLNDDGSVTYIAPTTTVPGDTAHFTEVVKDSVSGATRDANVYIQFKSQPPVVQNETLSGTYGATTTYTAAQLTAGDTDPQGGTLSISAVSGSNVKLNSDGTVTFTAPTSPVSGDTSSFGFTVKDTAGQTANASAAVNLGTPPQPSINQLQTVGSDIMQFYHDQRSHKSTTSDLSKLTTDIKGLNLNQYSLGQLLGNALSSDAGSNASTLGFALSSKFYPALANDLAGTSGNLSSDLNSMITTTAAVGDTYSSLVKHESASLALTQTETQYKLS